MHASCTMIFSFQLSELLSVFRFNQDGTQYAQMRALNILRVILNIKLLQLYWIKVAQRGWIESRDSNGSL